jgi:hypothetical protein
MISTLKVFSQNESVIIIKAGEQISVAQKHFFRYPEFIMGKVYFKNGDSAKARMNYNFVLGAIQYLDLKKDTITIANESEVRFIVIEKDTFLIREQQYLEVLKDYKFGKLLVNQKIKLLDEHRAGAYGITSPTQTIEAKESLKAESIHKLLINSDLHLSKEKQYYLLNTSNKIVPVAKKFILQTFSEDKRAVEDYINQNNINFKNEQDLQNLFTYLATL